MHAGAQLFAFLPAEIREQLLLDRDPHGNVQVAKIETEKLIILLCEKELAARKTRNEYAGKFKTQVRVVLCVSVCALFSLHARVCASI